MLSREAYEQTIQFLVEALHWNLSSISRGKIYERIAKTWNDNDLYEHALRFCDRGHGTPAQFLASLKEERRLIQNSAQAPALPPCNQADALPPIGQLRIWKMLALMKNGHQVDWDLIELNETDLATINQAYSNQHSCIQALQKIYQKVGRSSSMAAAISHAL